MAGHVFKGSCTHGTFDQMLEKTVLSGFYSSLEEKCICQINFNAGGRLYFPAQGISIGEVSDQIKAGGITESETSLSKSGLDTNMTSSRKEELSRNRS